LSELHEAGPSAILVHIDFRRPQFHEELDEFVELVASSCIRSHATISGSRTSPDARYFIGSGKVEEIREAVEAGQVDIVIFNHELSPAQERNLEAALKCRVVDRIGLILDIFALRAQSYEGKLQVELAQLQHLSTRLVRGWTHLERQKGGIGLRGPGETQLETDRRLIGRRIKSINARLLKVRTQRAQGRRLRKNNDTPVISLVGYTNAGKSTLFTQLTGIEVYAADKLFATLDTTLRKVDFIPGKQAILSDTVGFIRHIPHDLIESFRATLDEIKEADLLLHVIDANDEQRHVHMQQVNQVIKEIGAEHVPQIEVYNKIDLNEGLLARQSSEPGQQTRVWLSAKSGAGVEALREIISKNVWADNDMHRLHLPASAGKLRASLYEHGAVHEESIHDAGGWLMTVSLEPSLYRKLCHRHGLEDALES
jgi:GTP-binding protein HflX